MDRVAEPERRLGAAVVERDAVDVEVAGVEVEAQARVRRQAEAGAPRQGAARESTRSVRFR